MVLHTFENKEEGLTAFVNEHVKGFSVTMKDEDSGEWVPFATIYPNVDAAIASAKKAVSC